MKSFWDESIRALILVRFGQELGTNSALAQHLACFVDVVICWISKIV